MARTRFLNNFPVPRYLRMPGAGIEVSGSAVRYVELIRKRGRTALARYGTRHIARGVFENGALKDAAAFTAALQDVRSALGTSFVVVSLPEEQAFLSTISLTHLTDRDMIRNALEVEIEEHIPLKVEEATFDFQIVAQGTDNTTVNVTALPRELVGRYRDAIIAAGFTPIAFEMEAQPLARAVIRDESTEPSLIVDFGKTRTSLVIVYGGYVQFTTTIAVCGDDMTASVMKNLGVGEVEAGQMKKEKGFARNKENEALFNAMLPQVSAVKEEVEKLIWYWRSHNKDKHTPIARIVLSGSESRLKGLSEYFAYELKVPADRANPWANIVSFDDYIPDMSAEDAVAYTTAIGLAIRASGYYEADL